MHNLPRCKFLAFTAALVLSIAAGVPTAGAQNTTAPASIAADLSPDLIEDLVAANRILAHYGIFDAYGHISVRSRANPNRYLMARYLPPASTVAADITAYDLDSNALFNSMTDDEARRAEASAVAPVPVDRAWIHWRKEVLGK